MLHTKMVKRFRDKISASLNNIMRELEKEVAVK